MRFAIVGAGGVGGYFGGRLAAVHDVLFVARGAHLTALQSNGLSIRSANGDLERIPVRATAEPSSEPPADVVLVCVKLWDTTAAIETIRPLVGPDTVVMSLQNGITATSEMVRAFGAHSVVGATCHIAAEIAEPGIIKHTGTIARITIGELGGVPTDRIHAIAQCFIQAGLEAIVTDDIQRALWEKFILLATFSGLTTSMRKPIGEIRTQRSGRRSLLLALEEVCAVARRMGIRIPAGHADTVMSFIDQLPEQMKSSMLIDFERGRPLELPWLSGTVVELGKTWGVATPVHSRVVSSLTL